MRIARDSSRKLRTGGLVQLNSLGFRGGLAAAGTGHGGFHGELIPGFARWRKAIDLADAVYTATGEFPRDERFGLASQLRRAAVSIPSNVAEGRAIGGGRFLHHLRIALGSEAELETQIELAKRRGYITHTSAGSLTASAAEIARMLHALHKNVKAREMQRRASGIPDS